MKNKCINFKLFILMILPIVGFVVGLLVLILSCSSMSVCVIGLLFGMLCLSILFYLFINEPLYYYIDDKGIEIHSFFKKKIYKWQEIVSIKPSYDDMFELLFIKDYVIYPLKAGEYVRRMDRVVKCKKTTALINKFYNKSIG